MSFLLNPYRFSSPVNAVDFNGSTDYLTGPVSATGTRTVAIFSCWLRIDGGDGGTRYIFRNNGAFFDVWLQSTNKFRITLKSTTATSLDVETVNTYTASSSWIHLLFSCTLSSSEGLEYYYLYVNGASDMSVITDSGAQNNYNVASGGVGSVASNDSGTSGFFNGCLSELYFNQDAYLDFSVQANREKFILGGKPVNLGNSGQLPTGSSPVLYLKGPAASVGTNSGTRGDWTVHGAPTVASSSPSD